MHLLNSFPKFIVVLLPCALFSCIGYILSRIQNKTDINSDNFQFTKKLFLLKIIHEEQSIQKMFIAISLIEENKLDLLWILKTSSQFNDACLRGISCN